MHLQNAPFNEPHEQGCPRRLRHRHCVVASPWPSRRVHTFICHLYRSWHWTYGKRHGNDGENWLRSKPTHGTDTAMHECTRADSCREKGDARPVQHQRGKLVERRAPTMRIHTRSRTLVLTNHRELRSHCSVQSNSRPISRCSRQHFISATSELFCMISEDLSSTSALIFLSCSSYIHELCS